MVEIALWRREVSCFLIWLGGRWSELEEAHPNHDQVSLVLPLFKPHEMR
jgi:hypothetical protein